MTRAIPSTTAELLAWHRERRTETTRKAQIGKRHPGRFIVCEDGTTRLSLPADVHSDRRWFW